MEYARHFKFLVCARNFDETDLEGARLRDILAEIERLGYSTIRARRDDDAELVVHHGPAPWRSGAGVEAQPGSAGEYPSWAPSAGCGRLLFCRPRTVTVAEGGALTGASETS